MRVLVAENDEMFANVVAKICTDLGCEVVTAQNPEDVAKLLDDRFNAVVLDNRLIVGSGEDHGAQLLIGLRRKGWEVLLMTEFPTPELEAISIGQGAEFLSKEGDLASTAARIATIVGQMKRRVSFRDADIPYDSFVRVTKADYQARARHIINSLLAQCKPKTAKRMNAVRNDKNPATRSAVLALSLSPFSAYLDKLHAPKDEIGIALVAATPQFIFGVSFDSKLNIAESLTLAQQGNIQKVHLYHALSALPDSILLLAEMGRATRIAAFLDAAAAGLSDSKLQVPLQKGVRLTGPSFAYLGMKMRALGISASDLEGAVRGRQAIYAIGGFRVTVDELEGDSGEGKRVHRPEDELIKEFFRNAGTPPATGREALAAWGDSLEALIPQDLQVTDWRRLVACAKKAADKTGEVSVATITYFMGESAVLHDDPNTLKVAVESERSFDSFFKQFEKELTLSTFYFEQYRFGDKKVLPYNSWSGDLSALDATAVPQHVILLDPVEDTSHADAALILATRPEDRCRWVADYLSFIQFAKILRTAPKVRNALIAVDPRIQESMEWHAELLPQNTMKWLERIGSPEADGIPNVPAHFIPFLWTEDEWKDRAAALAHLFSAVGIQIREM